MRRSVYILSLLLSLTSVLVAADKRKSFTPAELEKMIEHVRGNFDMSRNPRPYIVYMILDQQANRYPSFWCGRNVEGKVAFKGQVDVLDEKITVSQTGAFTVQLTNSARKYGMFERMPGGVWVEKLGELNFRVSFESFEFVELKGLTQFGGDRSIAGNMVTLDTTCRGHVQVGERRVPFAGKALLKFNDRTELFLLHATFPFPGKELGLAGATGEGITATLYTASTPAQTKPDAK